MTLQTSEALKKHESKLSIILFAKIKKKKRERSFQVWKYLKRKENNVWALSHSPTFVILRCTLTLFPRMVKGKQPSVVWPSLSLPNNHWIGGVKALGRVQGVWDSPGDAILHNLTSHPPRFILLSLNSLQGGYLGSWPAWASSGCPKSKTNKHL